MICLEDVHILAVFVQYHTIKEGLEEKIIATTIMSKCSESLFEIIGENSDDLYNSGLVGVDSSSITTIFDTENKSMKSF